MALEPCVTPIKESRLRGSVTHGDELKETQTIELHASYLPLCSGIYSPRSPCSALFQRELYSPGSLALWLLGRSANMKDEEQERSQRAPRFLPKGHPGSGCISNGGSSSHQPALPSGARAPARHHPCGSSSRQRTLASGVELHHLLSGSLRPPRVPIASRSCSSLRCLCTHAGMLHSLIIRVTHSWCAIPSVDTEGFLFFRLDLA